MTTIKKNESQILKVPSKIQELHGIIKTEEIDKNLHEDKHVLTKKSSKRLLAVSIPLQEAIAEIESTGSYSESDDLQEMNEENISDNDSYFILEEPDKLLDIKILSDEMSLSDEETDSLKDNKSESKLEFLNIFEEVPEIEELSADLTDDFNKIIALEIEPIVVGDKGVFVNPLTGNRSLSSSVHSIESKADQNLSREESLVEETETEKKLSLEYKTDTSFEGILKTSIGKLTDDYGKDKELFEYEEAMLQLFLEPEKPADTETQDKINAAQLAQERSRQNQQIITEFLNKLFDHCVDKAEYTDDNIILRKNLDKKKLIEELKAKYDLFASERRVKQFLEQKCVVHFKRKSSFRLISADDPKTIKVDHERFCTALNNLNKWIKKEKGIKSLSSTQVDNLNAQYEEDKHQSNAEVEMLEELIRTTFQREGFTKLEMSVKNRLDKMSAVRKEISEVRFRLLLIQHEVSSLKTQLENLEDLGNGLNITQYKNLEIETLALNKKIEERNSTLAKLYNDSNRNLHSISHLKEKQKMLLEIVSRQKYYFENLQEKRMDLRKFVTQLRVKRKSLRLEIRDLSFQCGLLDKPVLMKDFDETVEMANKLSQANQNLKRTINYLAAKVASLKEKCIEQNF